MSMAAKLAALAGTVTGPGGRDRGRQVRLDVPGPGATNAGVSCRRDRSRLPPPSLGRSRPSDGRGKPKRQVLRGTRRTGGTVLLEGADRRRRRGHHSLTESSSACARLNRRTDRRRAASATQCRRRDGTSPPAKRSTEKVATLKSPVKAGRTVRWDDCVVDHSTTPSSSDRRWKREFRVSFGVSEPTQNF